MGSHTFDASGASGLDDPSRFRYCSREELVAPLELDGDEVVADLGSGTGFYTTEIAPYADTVHAIDVQRSMHEYFLAKEVPKAVELTTAEVGDLPFADGAFDAAYSTMTYHEFVSDDALAELARTIAGGGRLVLVDWSANGAGEAGPPPGERFSLADAREALESSGFAVTEGTERPETFHLAATRVDL
ncbi:MAG: ubiquinone/menaquinone biosynthesis C-methylase UbiE [Halobacteriales archaeon]|jgi:ubiquinone/menaquinone biosynthesis C-methylase UbiE